MFIVAFGVFLFYALYKKQITEQMMEQIEHLLKKLHNIESLKSLEELRIEVLGKKGILTEQFSKLRNLANDEKKNVAKHLNTLKQSFETLYAKKKQSLEEQHLKQALRSQRIDVSLFNQTQKQSLGHPLNYIKNKIIEYFVAMGYQIEVGPLVEDYFHNFQALNIPEYHPARDMQDTFYFNDNKLLRTHTSPMQIRTMMSQPPPIRMICPGETFRRDYDVTHSPMFHQVEGLVVDVAGKVSFAHLKYILEDFLQYMFGDVNIRFRASFFPFTEPSAEVDISCVFCNGGGCRVCSHTGWLEVMGCGMVNDNVFKMIGYKNVSGYAFGLGIERMTMLSLGINDLRSFFENDLRLLEQF